VHRCAIGKKTGENAVAAWNIRAGETITETSDFSRCIARPDGEGGPPDESIPEPGTILLVGVGLGGLTLLARRRRRRSK
jgi:hypothetical protein